MFKGINAITFNKRFPDNESCYNYLIKMKWGKGYHCSRCGCADSVKGRTYYHRRCQQCRYDESVTANTIFHAMKMPMLKAFHIVFRLSAKKKGMSTVELGAEVGVQQKTAWLFKRKIQVVMKQRSEDRLKGNVDVDETMLGYHTDRKHGGRNLEKREALMVGVEILDKDQVGNIRIEKIENFQAATLKCAMKEMVDSTAQIRTDDYISYHKIQQEGMDNITIEPSQNGQAFKQIHRQIMVFKNWLVGIHHKWSKEHLYAYADEYVFRFNKRNQRKLIFNSLIKKMMHQIPHPYPEIKRLCAYST